MTPERATRADLPEILTLFDGVQRWLVEQELKGQWGDRPFSSSCSQHERFAAWLDVGDFYAVRTEAAIVATLVLGTQPPDYAKRACERLSRGTYLEALTVHRDYAGQGVGSKLLAWAEQETLERGFSVLRLDCWAENKEVRTYYERADFRKVSELRVGEWRGILFEKKLKVPA